MNRTILFVGTAMLSLGGFAQAQEVSTDTGAAETVLQEVLVTDGRTPVEAEKSGRAFTVITGEQLEQQQIRYLADALRQVPGFAVSRTGSYGGFTQVRVRGAEANQLLVMVDGVEMNETSSGEFDFGSLLVDNVDRIEVLRGPQSAFWGANAMAGVVNIITKRGERDGFTIGGRTETGTDGTVLGGISMSGGGENYDISLAGAYRQNEGFNISDYGSEKDGDRNATLNGRASIDLTPDLTIDATLRYVDRKSDTDPQDFTYDPITFLPGPFVGQVVDRDDAVASQEFFGSVGATYVSLDGALTQKARFAGSDTHRDNYERSDVVSWDDGNRYNGTYQATYEFETPGFLNATHQITGGYEWERETFLPSHLEDIRDEPFERTTNSFIAEYRGAYHDQYFVNAAIRQDLNDEFADTTTFSLSGAWKIPDSATRLHGSVGTGVTNPTFYEQYGYYPGSFIGNPNLMPEESLGWDIGIEQGFFDGALVADITYFNQDLKDEIATAFTPTFESTPINRDGKSKRQGVEVSATLDLHSGFSATATYTYTDANEQTVAGGERLDELRRPRHSGSLGAAYVFYDNRARVFAELTYNGEMEDNAFIPGLPPRVTLDAYTLVNIGGSFKFNDKLEAFARVENLFDEEYEEVFGYNTPGRTAFMGLRGTF